MNDDTFEPAKLKIINEDHAEYDEGKGVVWHINLKWYRKFTRTEEPCNFCGTPNSEYPNRKCARTSICTNDKDETDPA